MSSSSDDEFFLDNIYLKTLVRKRVGVHDINRRRREFGEYHHLFAALKTDSKRFFGYMRMEIATFNYILTTIEDSISKSWCNWHQQPIFAEERLVICLRYLATGASFKSLAFSFRVGASTVGNIVREVVFAIWDKLQTQHMPKPNKQDFLQIADNIFRLWNFPNCLGAIDGKHVRIKCPNNTGSMFYNYKHFFSLVLQGVADANYRFITIDVGGYGKQSDGGTFQASNLYELLQKQDLDIPEPAFLPGTNVKAPFVFLGDEAYPLLPCLLTPYARNDLGIDEENYNKRLSRMRKSIECTFGILYAKWRLLSKSIETDVDVAESIIKCICLLHNIIIDKEGVQHNLIDTVVVPVSNTKKKPLGRPTNEAKSVRDVFMTYFANNPLNYHLFKEFE